MGRKPKYATLLQYQSHIDVIRNDLSIPDTFPIEFRFSHFTGASGGYIKFRQLYAVIVIEKTASKKWIIQALMHELMHLKQYLDKHLSQVWVPIKIENGKKKKNTGKWMYNWKDTLYPQYSASRTQYKHQKYLDQPWEIEAREYENDIYRLFPGLKLPRIFLGTASDGTKFYKMKG